jgi:hypothetical protein
MALTGESSADLILKPVNKETMKRTIKITFFVVLATLAWAGCSKRYPIDGDGLLITTRTECYVSNFDLLGSDFISVVNGSPVIDTTALTVHAEVFFGTDLHNLYPQFSLAQDCKLEPKITGAVDFSDTTHPRQYSVISGNRKIKKTYTIYISVQQP